jgi:hypothetical protein
VQDKYAPQCGPGRRGHGLMTTSSVLGGLGRPARLIRGGWAGLSRGGGGGGSCGCACACCGCFTRSKAEGRPQAASRQQPATRYTDTTYNETTASRALAHQEIAGGQKRKKGRRAWAWWYAMPCDARAWWCVVRVTGRCSGPCPFLAFGPRARAPRAGALGAVPRSASGGASRLPPPG